MSSASRSASSPASGSWSRTPSRAVRAAAVVARASGWSSSLDSASRACSAAVRRVSANPSRDSSARERGVLAGLRVDRLQLLEAEAEQVGLAGALPGARHHLVELALAGHQAGVPLGVRGQQRGGLLAPEPVEGLALRPGLQQAVLVGLPVHGDQRLGHAGQRGDRHGGAADEGAGAALGRDVAGQHHPAVLDLSPGLLDGGREPGQVADPDHALHPRAAGAGADGPAVGAAAEEQAERGHDHGLAGTGLTGDDGQARAELEGRGVDDAERADPDLLKHRGPRPAAGGARWSRASPRRAARTSRPAGR